MSTPARPSKGNGNGEARDWPVPVPVLYVACTTCQEHYSADDVQAMDIREDVHGRDVVTFWCPRCDKSVDSLVFTR